VQLILVWHGYQTANASVAVVGARALWQAAGMALRTTVVMKTDISGSTMRFRVLLAADLQALLSEHRGFIERHAALAEGRIVKPAGDGFWLEFSSVTEAAKAAMAMQEELRLAQPNRGDDRLAMRIVIALGDAAYQDGDLVGDVLALAARIEAITPPDEIYLSAAARLAANQAEIRTELVDTFALKGFIEPVPVYRIEQRHRTRVMADQCILISDLRGFAQVMQADVAVVERVLDALHALTHAVAEEFDGTIRFSAGDAYCLTFVAVERAIAAAERLSERWSALDRRDSAGCAINIALHQGMLYGFRSFFFGPGLQLASQVQDASAASLPAGQGGIFVTDAMRAGLRQSAWHNRLERVEVRLRRAPDTALVVYRLRRAASA
jgi:class 3 adenylate cyclase